MRMFEAVTGVGEAAVNVPYVGGRWYVVTEFGFGEDCVKNRSASDLLHGRGVSLGSLLSWVMGRKYWNVFSP